CGGRLRTGADRPHRACRRPRARAAESVITGVTEWRHMSDDRVFAKCAWRLIPLMLALFLANYIDRTNVAFAALTMNKDLGFSPEVFGFGEGILLISYA